jgi:hypothetical protein
LTAALAGTANPRSKCRKERVKLINGGLGNYALEGIIRDAGEIIKICFSVYQVTRDQEAINIEGNGWVQSCIAGHRQQT